MTLGPRLGFLHDVIATVAAIGERETLPDQTGVEIDAIGVAHADDTTITIPCGDGTGDGPVPDPAVETIRGLLTTGVPLAVRITAALVGLRGIDSMEPHAFARQLQCIAIDHPCDTVQDDGGRTDLGWGGWGGQDNQGNRSKAARKTENQREDRERDREMPDAARRIFHRAGSVPIQDSPALTHYEPDHCVRHRGHHHGVQSTGVW